MVMKLGVVMVGKEICGWNMRSTFLQVASGKRSYTICWGMECKVVCCVLVEEREAKTAFSAFIPPPGYPAKSPTSALHPWDTRKSHLCQPESIVTKRFWQIAY